MASAAQADIVFGNLRLFKIVSDRNSVARMYGEAKN